MTAGEVAQQWPRLWESCVPLLLAIVIRQKEFPNDILIQCRGKSFSLTVHVQEEAVG